MLTATLRFNSHEAHVTARCQGATQHTTPTRTPCTKQWPRLPVQCALLCGWPGKSCWAAFAGRQDQLETGAGNTSSKRSRVFTTVWHNNARCLSAHRCTEGSHLGKDRPCGGVSKRQGELALRTSSLTSACRGLAAHKQAATHASSSRSCQYWQH